MGSSDQTVRQRALDAAIAQIEKAHGRGSILALGNAEAQRIESISTSAINLDAAIGIGGVPRGRITEIYGPESSGKTTLALHIIANAQAAGGVACIIDAEHALDINYAARLGVDIESLLVSQPDHGEMALSIVEALVDSGAVDVVVVDSVAALVPRAEIEGEMGDTHVGLQARLMSQAMRKLAGSVKRSNTSLVFINQLREKVGVMFGSPETTSGGRALKFYASVRLDIRRISAVKDGQENIGNRTRCKVVKNKVAAPFRQAEFDILFNEGISTTGVLIDEGVRTGVIDKAGSWFSFGDLRLGQGREAARTLLRNDAELRAQVTAKLNEVLGIGYILSKDVADEIESAGLAEFVDA